MQTVERLGIEYVPTSELVPYIGNAKQHPKRQIKEIAASIRDFGFDDPIAVWHNADGEMEIVEGHGRLLAAEDMGLTTVPVITLDHLTDAERRAYTHVHNQTTLTSGFDEDKLMDDISELLQFEWEEYGFGEYVGATEDDEVEFSDDDEPALIETRCNEGDRWILGDHVLVCGDSTKQETWDKLMDGETADLLVTDPPYNVALGQTSGHEMRPSEAKQLHRRTDGKIIKNDSWDDDESFVAFLVSVYENALAKMKEGAVYYIWHASNQAGNFIRANEQAGMQIRQQIIWNKSNFCLGRQDYQWKHEPCLYGWKDGAAHYFVDDRTLTTVWDFEKPSRSELHPTMKPIPLIGRCVLNSSRKGELVIDPFGGSGSTLMACEESGRRCRTIELDTQYCDVIIQRWEDFTGKKAVRC